MNQGAVFSGSYDPCDVQFLLKPVDMKPTPVAEKERLIQTGTRHYSEIIAPEALPTNDYLELFHEAFESNRIRFAQDISSLARRIAGQVDGPILVSLARAGTPVGALLRRALQCLDVKAPHYSISIIRDRGIDFRALDFIVSKCGSDGIIFVDGWTGKGAIRRELTRTLGEYNLNRQVPVPDRLAVISDLAGCADIACNNEDYLIPSAILNAVISGLVSRTILNDVVVGPDDFHACLHYADWAEHDLSNWFLDCVSADVRRFLKVANFPTEPEFRRDGKQSAIMETLIAQMAARFSLTDINRIKPGIGEATRAVMRRMPKHLLLRDPQSKSTSHLVHIAEQRRIDVIEDPALPVGAVTIIQDLGLTRR